MIAKPPPAGRRDSVVKILGRKVSLARVEAVLAGKLCTKVLAGRGVPGLDSPCRWCACWRGAA